ncbi:uncharacterized protein MAM_04796 [Metarhizium album ARSEF 1941]|uniref:Transcription factor, fungi n=1 Tax=Metarhizium album (strain ARSEF 1941) TaxID=1081103 RepID=A0A0B2WU81_METAS|nr:uncharacterized protein MAM_04796 [Metarhizium album ARSEF 1941]KHN97199.1 Transcription factor, fungi [Metarhizium album ARSEF 1941]
MSVAPTTNSAPPPARKVKFVASDPSRGGLPVKRKQVQQACAACRRKKVGLLGPALTTLTAEPWLTTLSLPSTMASVATPRTRTAAMTQVNGIATPSRTARALSLHTIQPPYQNNHVSVTTPSQTHDLDQRSSRFVGDLNPEGMFLEATASTSARASSQKGDVGIWLSSGAFGGTGQSSQFITSRPPPLMDRFLLPFVREHCLSCLPPPEDFAQLKNVYIQKIHPIFPVIPIADIDNNVDHPCNIVLRQLVCLAAAADPEVTEHYRLQNREPGLLSPQDFSQSLSSSVRAILETSLITDRVLHIQALIMLSLYTQPTCAEESDLPAQLGGRAIHHIQTLGLHLLRYDAPNCADLENLFCCVWAVDRINAAEYGRPCLIHERDIGADLEACIRKRPPCFRLFLLVVQWLDQVIELYRPGPSAEASGLEKIAYIDLPVLEAMIVDADALKVPSFLIATIETFYHAVIILSCRLPRPGTVPAASTLPPPSANARRSLAAERIACAVPRDHLSPMPFIPYAVSLALSVEYRKMRHSRLPMFRARAMSSFRRNCEMLRNYGDHFWSANVVAGLGERVLREMERAATSLTTKEASPAPPDVRSRSASAGVQPQSMRQTDVLPCNASGITSAAGMDNAVDFSLIDAISGQDVFGHIDPSFNLDAVEDVLEANLDIGLPLNWSDWGQFASN